MDVVDVHSPADAMCPGCAWLAHALAHAAGELAELAVLRERLAWETGHG